MLRLSAVLALVSTLGCAADPPGLLTGDPRTAPKPGECGEGRLTTSLLATPGLEGSVQAAPCGDYVDASASCFNISFEQPIDHENPDRGTFRQMVKLVHRSCDAPTLVTDNGYAMNPNGFWSSELGTLFGANTINIEHRYQGDSAPSDRLTKLDALTIANGASDMHRIIQTFRRFYGGPFVTTGASKGGITAIYHRFFFPDDVEGTVPYVAPASVERVDERYQSFFETVGTDECRNALREYQRTMLIDRRKETTDFFAESFSLDWFEADAYVEQAAARSEWRFWQWDGVAECDSIPDPSAPQIEFLDFVFQTGPTSEQPVNDDPSSELDWLSVSWEWLTEQGFAQQYSRHLGDVLFYDHPTMEDEFTWFGPDVALPAHDPSITQAAVDWVASEAATNIVMIYGQDDPWTGAQLPVPTAHNSGRYTAPRTGHRASLFHLTPADTEKALAQLEVMFQRPAQATLWQRALRVEGAAREHLLKRLHDMSRRRLRPQR